MGIKAGIIGLPNVGKSTLFNAITNSSIEAANYPFATIEPNVGIVELPDARLDKIAKIQKPNKIIRSIFEFIDIAGLVEGASKGEGLGNKFLTNIREVDAIVHVVRCFRNNDIVHVFGDVDPLRDIKVINLELIMADIQTIDNVLNRISSKARNTNDKLLKLQVAIATNLKEQFEKEISARDIELSKDELVIIKQWNLLSLKPILYVANIAEENISNPSEVSAFIQLVDFAKKSNHSVIPISAKIEEEISQLEDEEKYIFLEDLGLETNGLDRITRASFNLLGLSTFFTSGPEETRSWTFKTGSLAPDCAGVIHTDFKKGFIKADVISYEDFITYKGEKGTREAGKLRMEGKTYIFKDGDIAHFKFNV